MPKHEVTIEWHGPKEFLNFSATFLIDSFQPAVTKLCTFVVISSILLQGSGITTKKSCRLLTASFQKTGLIIL